jgi:hypothetical protein
MSVVNAVQHKRSVADPTSSYESMRGLWEKSRAIIGGERFAKDFDGYLDVLTFSNLLIPFSPSMDAKQYEFYKAEAELPGIVSQYARIIIGGLLRKQPQLKLPEGKVPAGAYEWIMNHFSHNSSPLVSFLDEILWEEVQTSRAWVYVDYPKILNPEDLTREQYAELKPYPVIWNAESIINWRVSTREDTGVQSLEQIIVRNYVERVEENEFHPSYIDTVIVHEIVEGFYRIRRYEKKVEDAQVIVVNGKLQQKYTQNAAGADPKLSAYELVETLETILMNGERLTQIPAWPLNGSIRVIEPMLSPFIDKEVALYNKMSRRNHLLYGASTYTPVLTGNITDDAFDAIVDAGLGTWLKLPEGATATVLDTPTAALTDMDRAIASAIEDMAKLGIRMLTPETQQSGVALDIRNAAQTAQLGTLNIKVSNQMASIIAFMLNWRYDLQLKNTDIEFELSADFNPTPLGADWLRLATEWYQSGLIPRSIWLQILKVNDMISPDYNDEEGQIEITEDDMVMGQVDADSYASKVADMAGISTPKAKTPLKKAKPNADPEAD